jgi:hypothetical protein
VINPKYKNTKYKIQNTKIQNLKIQKKKIQKSKIQIPPLSTPLATPRIERCACHDFECSFCSAAATRFSSSKKRSRDNAKENCELHFERDLQIAGQNETTLRCVYWPLRHLCIWSNFTVLPFITLSFVYMDQLYIF